MRRIKNIRYTREELLEIIRQYFRDNGRPPKQRDFSNNPKFPNYQRCIQEFGSWNNALELALDIKRVKNSNGIATKEELLNDLKRFEIEHERPPTVRELNNNSYYYNFNTYVQTFGSWSNALKLVELDVESIVKRGIVETSDQKARLAEIFIRDHFNNPSIDLAGENKLSPCDGICPNGKTYDVKSSGFRKGRYIFRFTNRNKDKIDILYLLAFNRDYTNLAHAWRISALKFIYKDFIQINTSPKSYGEFTIENMKEYIITDQIRVILNNSNYFKMIRNYRNIKYKTTDDEEVDKLNKQEEYNDKFSYEH